MHLCAEQPLKTPQVAVKGFNFCSSLVPCQGPGTGPAQNGQHRISLLLSLTQATILKAGTGHELICLTPAQEAGGTVLFQPFTAGGLGLWQGLPTSYPIQVDKQPININN